MSEINVTPLVDVMLVLVVIFIITAPLLASSIKLDLPRSDAAKPGEAPQFVSVVVDKAGRTFLNEPLWFDTDHLSPIGVRDRTLPLQIEIERALDSL